MMGAAEARALIDGYLDSQSAYFPTMHETVALCEGPGPWEQMVLAFGAVPVRVAQGVS